MRRSDNESCVNNYCINLSLSLSSFFLFLFARITLVTIKYERVEYQMNIKLNWISRYYELNIKIHVDSKSKPRVSLSSYTSTKTSATWSAALHLPASYACVYMCVWTGMNWCIHSIAVAVTFLNDQRCRQTPLIQHQLAARYGCPIKNSSSEAHENHRPRWSTDRDARLSFLRPRK